MKEVIEEYGDIVLGMIGGTAVSGLFFWLFHSGTLAELIRNFIHW